MQVIHEPDPMQAAEAISDRLQLELSTGKKVTWFICGGSNILLVVRSMSLLDDDATANLTILLTDERYGVPGHPDSNWKQLDDAGFQPKQAKIIRTLHSEATLDDTCTSYADSVRQAIGDADMVIAQFGIGGDGHIAGILPQTDASGVSRESEGYVPLVVGYDAGAYQRITITPPVWQDFDVAFACVYGENKLGALDRLVNQDLSVDEQPAQLLKTVPEAYLYTDQQIPTKQ